MTAEENVVAPVESVAVPGAEEVPIATSTLTPTPVDESTPIVSDLQAKIIKQIEFYFHDANLARDNFLLAELKKNEDQWVSLPVIASFNRVKALSEDVQVVAEALRQSMVLEVNDDGSMVRRAMPFSAETADDSTGKILFTNFLPKDKSLDELLEFFGQFGKVALIRRRMKDGQFTGIAWVQYESEEDAKNVSAKRVLKWGTDDVKVSRKEDWIAAAKTRKPRIQDRTLRVHWDATTVSIVQPHLAIARAVKKVAEKAEDVAIEGVSYVPGQCEAFVFVADGSKMTADAVVLACHGKIDIVVEPAVVAVVDKATAGEEVKVQEEAKTEEVKTEATTTVEETTVEEIVSKPSTPSTISATVTLVTGDAERAAFATYTQKTRHDEQVSYTTGTLARFELSARLDMRTGQIKDEFASIAGVPVARIDFAASTGRDCTNTNNGFVLFDKVITGNAVLEREDLSIDGKTLKLTAVIGEEEYKYHRDRVVDRERFEEKKRSRGSGDHRGGRGGRGGRGARGGRGNKRQNVGR